MTPDLQELLFGAFPLAYALVQKTPPRPWATRPADLLYHFPGDGWFDLIFDMSERLEERLVALPKGKRFWAVQVKEKWGVFRVYLGGEFGTFASEDSMIVTEAEARSKRTCEVCGRPGSLRKGRALTDRGPLLPWATLCTEDDEKRHLAASMR